MTRVDVALRRSILGLTALGLALPLVVVLLVSFNPTHRMNFPPSGLSLKWYGVFFTDPQWLDSLAASLSVGALASLTSVAVALPIAYLAWATGSRAARWLAAAGSGLFLMPTVVSAMMFVIFWGTVRHVGRMENIVLSHAVVFLAIPIGLISVGLDAIDRSLVEAASTMGADEADAFRLVIRPSITPHVICSLMFVFVLSLNEYLIAYMVSGFTTPTLPVRIFNTMRSGYEPSMCVAAVLFMAIGFAVFSLLAAFGDLPRLLGRDRPIPR